MILQEKFQISVPYANKHEDDGCWKDFESARVGGDVSAFQKNNKVIDQNVVMETNLMPPGMEITNTKYMRHFPTPLTLAGQGDVSGDVTNEAMREGFTRRQMKGTDDQYSGEHMDHFYGEAVGDDGNVGFAERNNYLDRE